MALSDRLATAQVQAADPAVSIGTFDQGASVVVRALSGNSGTVYVGSDATVDNTNGFPLGAGEAISFDYANPSKVFVYSGGSDSVAVMVTY